MMGSDLEYIEDTKQELIIEYWTMMSKEAGLKSFERKEQVRARLRYLADMACRYR